MAKLPKNTLWTSLAFLFGKEERKPNSDMEKLYANGEEVKNIDETERSY